jgi:predicted molibdopterin-dependent oxidoreductase YjgC
MRINHPSVLLPEIQRGMKVKINVDGNPVDAYEGETVAQPRGIYCGMGICYECLVTINGVHAQRACVTPVMDGMQIETCKELVL